MTGLATQSKTFYMMGISDYHIRSTYTKKHLVYFLGLTVDVDYMHQVTLLYMVCNRARKNGISFANNNSCPGVLSCLVYGPGNYTLSHIRLSPLSTSIEYDVFYHVRFAYEHVLVLYLLLHAWLAKRL